MGAEIETGVAITYITNQFCMDGVIGRPPRISDGESDEFSLKARQGSLLTVLHCPLSIVNCSPS
jgi:hypothetical protein